MCGICGFYEFKSASSDEALKNTLIAMCKVMEHRGPDDLGIYISHTGMNLGAVRLSIIDLGGGHQPLSNEDGSCWVALNGEIYNYPSLRLQLENLGHRFATHCDTEAVIHAYEQWGVECAKHLEGMFAFAIVDKNHQRLMLARDRFGKKPLYYSQTEDTFVFGSEIKAFLAYQESSFEIDATALGMYITLGYIPGPMSIYKNIKKLLPGHYLTVNRHRVLETNAYWDLSYTHPNSTSTLDWNAAVEETTTLLERSVEARLIADVPIGVFLSGGIDSSIVTAFTRKFKKDQLKSFSVRFLGTEQDESSYSKIVAEHLGTEHYELDANHCPPDVLRKLVWHCDEPLADPAIVPTYLVSQLAKEQVTVVLTGEGADEVFGGYFYHPLEKQAANLDWLPTWIKRNLLPLSAKTINKLIGRQRYHPRTIWSWEIAPAERMLAWMSIFTDADKSRWFSPSIDAINQMHHTAEHFRQVANQWGPYNRNAWLAYFMYIDAKIPLVDDLLMKVDKMSMAASLEARCPFLDHHLVEYAYNLPEEMKFNHHANKLILRKIAAKILPEAIYTRKKHGFDVPLKKWLTEDLDQLFWDLVSSRPFMDREIISQAQIRDIWNAMLQDIPNSYRQVWSLLILATWFDVYTR